MATVADLNMACRLAHLSLSATQDKGSWWTNGSTASLPKMITFSATRCVYRCGASGPFQSQLHVSQLICKTPLPVPYPYVYVYVYVYV